MAREAKSAVLLLLLAGLGSCTAGSQTQLGFGYASCGSSSSGEWNKGLGNRCGAGVISEVMGDVSAEHAVTPFSPLRGGGGVQKEVQFQCAAWDRNSFTKNDNLYLPIFGMKDYYFRSDGPGLFSTARHADLHLDCDDMEGKHVFIVGGAPQLGSWVPSQKVPMHNRGGGMWSTTRMIDGDEPLKYKFVIVDKGHEIWEREDRYLYVDGDEYPIVVSSPGFNDHHTTVALSADANKMWIRNPDVQVVSSDSSDALEKVVPVQAAESVKKGPTTIPTIVVAASEDLVERVKSGTQGAAILNTFVVDNAKKFEHVTNGVKASVSSVPSLVVENAKKGVDAAKELGSTVGKSAAAGIGATAKIPTLAIRNALKVVVGASKLPAAAWHSAAERVSVSAVQLKSSASGACGSVADVCCSAGQGVKGAAAGVGNAARATVRAPIGIGKMAASGLGNVARTTVRAPIGFGKMAASGLGNVARTTVRAPIVLAKQVGRMPALAIEKVGEGLSKPARALASGVSHLGNIVSVPGRFLTQGGLGAYGQQVGESWSRFADRFTTGIGASKRHFVQDISRACVSLQSAQHATGAVLGRWVDYMKLRGGLVVLTGLLGAAAWQQYTGIGAEEIAALTRREVLRAEHKKKPTASWQDLRQPARACDRASMYSGFMPDALASTAQVAEKNQRGKLKRQQSSKDMGPSFSQILGGFAPTSEHDTPHKVVVNFLKMGFVLLFGDLAQLVSLRRLKPSQVLK